MPIVIGGGGPLTGPGECDPTTWVAAEDLACSTPSGGGVDYELAVLAATDFYDRVSGHQFGFRCRTLYPLACNPACRCAPRLALADYWSTEPWGCGCGRVADVDLGVGTAEVTSVTVGGVALDAADWLLYDGRRLVAVEGSFPCCQSLASPSFEVVAVVGSPVPALGVLAVREMACEMAKGMAGEECALPFNTQSYSRQNVSVTVEDGTSIREGGYPGLRFGNLFLASLDHQRKPGRATSLSRPTRSRPTV